MALGRLSIILDANIANFTSDLGRAARIAEAQSKNIQQSLDRAGRAIGLALSAGVATLGVSVKKSLDDMLQLGIAAKQVGMPTQQFTALAGAARRADVDVQSFTTAMMAADKALAMARSGTGAQAQAFKALGIDPKQVKDNNDLILKASDALSKYKDGVGKTAVEMAIFGRSGAQLNGFLDQGSAAISEQTQHMQELGIAFGPEAQAQLAAYDAAQKEFADTVTGLRNRIAIALLPSLRSATEFIGGMVKSMDKDAISGFTAVINTLSRAALVVAGTFDVAGKSIGGTFAVIKTAFQGYDWKKDGVGPGAALTALARNFGTVRTVAKQVGSDLDSTISQWTQRIASFGDSTAKAAAKATGGNVGRRTLTFDANAGASNAAAAAKIKALAQAYDALALAAQKANEKQLTPQGKALADYTDGVRALAKAAGDYVAKGGDAAKTQNLFLQGKSGLWQQYTRAVQAATAADAEFSKGLQNQLALQKQAIDIQVASIGMGSKEADRLLQRNALEQQGAEAIRQLTLERDKYLSTDPQYQVLTKHIQEQAQANQTALDQQAEGFKRLDDATSDWRNGFRSALDDFNDRMNNTAQQTKDFTNDFIDGFGDAFAELRNGVGASGKAFDSFIDSLLADAMRALANKALQSLFNLGSSSGGANDVALGTDAVSGGGGFWGGIANFAASLFGGGKAVGGPVQAGSLYQVNERGPELLSVAGKDFLMMGNQSGRVTPNDRLGGGTTINVNVQPTSSRRTASQVAEAVARKQQLAMARA